MNLTLFSFWIVVVAGIWTGVVYLFRDLTLRRFKPTVATIVKSEVYSSSGAGPRGTHRPDIEFHYSVGGKRYNQGRYRLCPVESTGKEDKVAICRRYPVGASCEAWYDPKRPEVAVLNRRISLFPPLLIVVFSCFGYFLWTAGK